MSVSISDDLADLLRLPPVYNLVTLREHGDAFAHACGIAAEEGAGTLVLVRRFDVLEFAVVLEPEEPLATARRALFAGMAAIADAIGSYCPPEKSVTFAWPDTILYDGARLGGGRLGWPADCPEDAVPGWMVFSASLLVSKTFSGEPGLTPESTSLEEEGLAGEERMEIVGSFCRHLLTAFDAWSDRGFKAVADLYLARMPRDDGQRYGIDPNGDLLIQRSGTSGIERKPFRPALDAVAWRDRNTGLPRL